MAKLSLALFTGLSVLVLTDSAIADEQAEPRAVVDKAIQAMGGQERMARFPAFTWKAQGTLYAPALEIAMTEEGHAQGDDHLRLEMTQEIRNRGVIKQTQVIKGDEGWITKQTQCVALPKQAVSARKAEFESLRRVRFPTLLKQPAIRLSPLGELKIHDRDAIGVGVAQEGRPDLNLWFDKETGFPIKSEMRVKEGAQDREVVYEFYYSDYKEFSGLKSFTKMTWDKDGKRFAEKTWSEIEPRDKLDSALFEKP